MTQNWFALTSRVHVLLEKSVGSLENPQDPFSAMGYEGQDVQAMKFELAAHRDRVAEIKLLYQTKELPRRVSAAERAVFAKLVEDSNKLDLSVDRLHSAPSAETIASTLDDLQRFTAEFIGTGPHSPGLPPPDVKSFVR